MENNFIVDRIEGNYAVIECHNGDIIEVLLSKIKSIPKEGDVLIKKEDIFTIDIEGTLNRREKINNMMKNMWK